MRDQQSTPLNSDGEPCICPSYLGYPRGDRHAPECETYRDGFVAGAARERLSALDVDVELMTDAWKNVLEAFGSRVLIRQNVMLLLAEYARLTEPDAGEGTER